MIRDSHCSTLLLFMTLAVFSCCQEGDLVSPVPGYPSSFQQKVYSGYLDTGSSQRKLHYVLVESEKTGADVPLTLWLNGGPGCSSMIGFLQEIGPYFLEEGVRYKAGDQLIENPYSWHKESHLLFIESPAGVGYSVNTNSSFVYNDATTAQDNFNALLSFFTKFSAHSKRPLWLSGQSYAGKYIPDLAVKIDEYNEKGGSTPVNLKGILVGNGVMSFTGGTLEQNTIEYMVNQDFIDPDLLIYYRGSCLADPSSAGCRYFMTRYSENIDEINPYNIYSYCFYNDSFTETEKAEQVQKRTVNRQTQSSILSNLIRNNGTYKSETFNGPTCAYFDGMLDYFTAHLKNFHASTSTWEGPCSDTITGQYTISLRGSMEQYRYLLDRLDKYHIVLYNGDWDSVVPFSDTEMNIQKLNLQPTNIYKPFFAEGQHAGWIQIYGGLLFIRIKGGSHMVPQSKRAEAYQMFKMVVQSIGNTDKVVLDQ